MFGWAAKGLLALAMAGATGVSAQVLNDGENLLVDIPPGFVLAHREDTPQGPMEEFIPQGQTLDNWGEMITLQLFPDWANAAPVAFLTRLSDLLQGACPEADAGTIYPLQHGGYPAGLVLLSCPDSPRTGGVESFAAFAISGRERMYVLQYAWTRPAGAAEFAQAQAFFEGARLCDTTRADAPCPEG